MLIIRLAQTVPSSRPAKKPPLVRVCFDSVVDRSASIITDPCSLFSLHDHLEDLSQQGDPPGVLERTVEFGYSRPWLVEGLDYNDAKQGRWAAVRSSGHVRGGCPVPAHAVGRPNGVQNRLSWMRFLGFSLGDHTPCENTSRCFCNGMAVNCPFMRVMTVGQPTKAQRLLHIVKWMSSKQL